MSSGGPANQIGRGQIDLLLFLLLGKVQLLYVIEPAREVEVALLFQVGQVFLKERKCLGRSGII